MPPHRTDCRFRFVELKDDRVRIYSDSRLAKTLKGSEAARFLSKSESCTPEELQMLMAKVTGQFKFGNER